LQAYATSCLCGEAWGFKKSQSKGQGGGEGRGGGEGGGEGGARNDRDTPKPDRAARETARA
jgi:hypothetical protein